MQAAFFPEDASTLLQTVRASRLSLFLYFSFKPVGTTRSLKEEGFLSMQLLFKSLRMIPAIVATCGLFSLHNKGRSIILP